MTVADKPLPIPPPSIKYDTRPSLFAPPPKSTTRIPKTNPPVFPQSRFTEWMKSPVTRDELLGELVRNTSPAAEQFSTFVALRKHAEETKKIRKNVTEMKNEFEEFKKLGQKIEKRLDDIHARITKAEDLQARNSDHLLSKLPPQDLMQDAPSFFIKRDDWTVPPPTNVSTQPCTQEEFELLPRQQRILFYNQSALQWALWNPKQKHFDSVHHPRPEYHDYSCQLCHLFGHIMYDCPRYECPCCKNNCGRTPDKCTGPIRSADRVIMMADVPKPSKGQQPYTKTPLIARMKEKRTFLAKEPSPPQDDSHLEITFIALEESVNKYVSMYTDKELQEQINKYLATHDPPRVPNHYYVPALRAEWTRRHKKRLDALGPFIPIEDHRIQNLDAFYDTGNLDPYCDFKS